MQGCQKDEKAVNGEIEITDSKKLLEKARGGLLKLSVSLGIRVMQMLFEEEGVLMVPSATIRSKVSE